VSISANDLKMQKKLNVTEQARSKDEATKIETRTISPLSELPSSKTTVAELEP
jgi:hypothetical protein